MELLNKKTIKGGKYQVNKMKTGDYSTNLWKDSWYIVSDTTTKELIDDIVKFDKASDLVNLEKTFNTLNALSSVGVKHIRATGTRTIKITTPISATPTSATTYEELKENTIENLTQETKQDSTQEQMNEQQYLEIVERAFKNLQNFILDFVDRQESIISIRQMDTMSRLKNEKEIKQYLLNYYSLQNNTQIEDLKEKIKQNYCEWETITNDLLTIGKYRTKGRVNNRLKIYYGPAGTGKTKKAESESDLPKMVCTSRTTPTDLIKVFDFMKDGQPQFRPSLLREAMEQGKTIVLDEINLLPENSLNLIQAISDNSTIVKVEGEEITIDPNFKIIGTMNLVVNGVVRPLPSPLVDRAFELKEFNLTPKELAKIFA